MRAGGTFFLRSKNASFTVVFASQTTNPPGFPPGDMDDAYLPYLNNIEYFLVYCCLFRVVIRMPNF